MWEVLTKNESFVIGDQVRNKVPGYEVGVGNNNTGPAHCGGLTSHDFHCITLTISCWYVQNNTFFTQPIKQKREWGSLQKQLNLNLLSMYNVSFGLPYDYHRSNRCYHCHNNRDWPALSEQWMDGQVTAMEMFTDDEHEAAKVSLVVVLDTLSL